MSLVKKDGIHGAPDLVVEIVSPSNGALEKSRKRPLYARHGVREEWLIEPELEFSVATLPKSPTQHSPG